MKYPKGKLKKPLIRILFILLGSAIYWVGYYGYLTNHEGDLYGAGCLFLIIVGLIMAGLNSSYLYRGK